MKTLRLRERPDRINLISDCHYESASTDLDALRRDLERPGRILLGGDIFDAIYPGDKRWTPTTLRREFRDTDDIVGAVLESAAEFFAPYADRVDMVAPGNHEARLRDKINADLVLELARRLRVNTAPYAGLIQYPGLRIGYWHGSGGGTSPEAALRQSRRLMDVAERLDVAWTGHRHQRFAMPLRRFNGDKLQRTWLVMSGAYSRWDGYATEKLCPPGDVGGVRLVMGDPMEVVL